MTTATPETDVDISELFKEEEKPYEDSNDPNRRTHVVRPYENGQIYNFLGGTRAVKAQDIVDFARQHGLEVVALCGYTWIPKHNPDKFDACEPCMALANHYISQGE